MNSPNKKAAIIETPSAEEALLTSLSSLNESIGVLNETLTLIREHEFVEFHKSKWKIFAYQILLGILFAMGTVLGLVLLSWMTYTFFKDSIMLRNIVDSQLKMRRFDFGEIKDRANTDAEKIISGTASVKESPSQTASGTLTPAAVILQK